MLALKDKTILVTGGTGSLGQPLISRLLKEGIKKIIALSRDEHKQVEMEREIEDRRIRFLLGDIRDRNRLKRAFQRVDFVIHCAALKHVHKCERDPIEAKNTNIDGAENIIEASIDCRVKRVLAISTDKAINPINTYGKAKALADDLFIQANQYGSTKFSVVRFGNFAGSRGSVIPLFKKQKECGECLTVTRPEMTRFFITFDNAVERIVEILSIMKGGEIFYPKMKSISIMELAYAIDKNPKKIIGMRDHEKLHEDLIIKQDAEKTHEIDNFYVVCQDGRSNGRKVAKDFSCSSANNKFRFTKKEIEDLIA